MADKHFIVATAGHIDHGKSALVRTLTGTDPDRLPEEKARGITIELGFAHLALPSPPPAADVFRLGIVDVPGHEDFVKNMVSGVGSVDAALFVVAADDGWMPQTEEHLQILAYLGVRRAVVALTKIDLATSAAAATENVRAALAGSPFAEAPIVPTSTVTGRGFDALQDALARVLADAPPPRDIGKPRLPVDRVFTLRGVGTVVTGTLTGGRLARGVEVVAQPSGRRAHVRAVQNHGREIEESGPGTRTALNLPEFAAAGDGAVRRGEVVTRPEFGGPARVLDVLLSRTDRQADPAGFRAVRALKDATHVRVHHGSGAWTARLSLLDRTPLAPGGRALARLVFDAPIFAFAGDRLIVRNGGERTTLAGGTVLDADPGRRPLRRAAQRCFLERRAAAAGDDAVAAAAAFLERDHAVPAPALLRRSLFSAAQAAEAVETLTARGDAIRAGPFVSDAAWWKTRRQQAADFIHAWHHDHPEQVGPPRSRLRAEIARRLPDPGLFDVLVGDLTGKGEFIAAGAAIRRSSHRPALPPKLQTSGNRLRAALSAKPFEPPSRRELAPDALSRQALRFLFDTGEAVELGEDIVLLEEHHRRMKTIIARTLRATGTATTSELRQVLGTTRRVLIPVLEGLDREGVTRREGDRRILR